MKVELIEEGTQGGSPNDVRNHLSLASPHYGDSATYARNLSMLVGSLDGGTSGTFQLKGTSVISIVEGKLSRVEDGSFDVRYYKNGSTEVSLSGTLSRSIDLPWPGQATEAMARILTQVAVEPSYGPMLYSFSDTSLRPSDALPAVLPWSFLLSGTRVLTDGMAMTVERDTFLEGLSLPMEPSSMSYRVMVGEAGKGTTRAVLMAESDPLPGMRALYSLVLDSTCPWPMDLDTRSEGLYISNDGPVSIDLRYRESLIGWTEGGGVKVQWPSEYGQVREGRPELQTVSEVPSGGSGGSSYVALPSQCYEQARSASPTLADFVGQHGPVSPLRLSYYRNDTRPSDRSWVWNITLSSSPSDSEGATMGLLVSCLGGDRLGKDQLELRDIWSGRTSVVPPTGRRMLTLSSHEGLLRSTSLADSFFTGEGHSPTFKLDIVHRGSTGPDPMNILVQNMLGMHRSDARDLYITSANDRLDPKTICFCVVDGSSGQMVSTTKASGSFVTLLNTYGFELA